MKITIEPLEPGDLKPFPADLGFGRHFSNRQPEASAASFVLPL